jgi:GT2 family glycosyltransferase
MLRATLWSLLRQTFQNFEVIIGDNASEEDTEAEVVAMKDSRMSYVRQEKNIGGAANFLFLQTLPRGEYVLFLCSDDLLLPDCLAKSVAALDSQPRCGGVVYMAAHYSENGFQFLSNMPDRDYAGAAEYEDDHAVRDFRFASPSLCLYRRAVFECLGGWNPNLLAVIDWDLYSRMIRCGGGLVFLHDVLAIMRLHGDRMSNTSALHWEFYHDVMLMSAQPEYQWGGAYRARTVVEQLLWDWRLRRSPRQTLVHAFRTKAISETLFYLPSEILRRLRLKVDVIFRDGRQAGVESITSSQSPRQCDLETLNKFWRDSELVRVGYVSALASR